jgi:pimeloyl-ACP methyl ester carboxylesterase
MVAEVKAPLLMIHDRDDRAVPLAHGQALAEAAPDARLFTVNGLGHRRLLADPEVVGTAVTFLRTGDRPVTAQPVGRRRAGEQRTPA